MRIMTISNAAWDDRNAVGNTQSNWFSDYPDTEICSMYTRESLPNNNCCGHYYQVTIADIARHLFSWNKIGRAFLYGEKSQVMGKPFYEGRIVESTKGWKKRLLLAVIEIVYTSKIWLNKQMKNYISSFNPDIVFCFAIAEPFRYSIISYVKKNTQSKCVMWIADDVYGQTRAMPFLTRHVYRRRYQRMFKMADKVYGVSQMLCDEYSRLYNIDIEPLYKGCEFSPCIDKVGYPIQMIYAGNLLYGRDKTLISLARTLKEINRDSNRIQLSIYSSTKVSDETKNQLIIDGSCQLYGPRPYEEIKVLMGAADIVLYVESFDEDQINKVRLSFSTKIIDCMQSGSAMLVIGPKGIASVEYLRSIEGVFVIDNLEDIQSSVCALINNPDSLIKEAANLFDYAKDHHDIRAVRSRLLSEFNSLTQSC